MGRDRGGRDQPDPLDVDDEVFSALGDSHRRFVLYYLLEHGTATVDELADVVAGWSSAGTPGMATPAERDRILAALVHRHLPSLTDAAFVEYDESAGTVSFDVDTEEVVALLEWLYRREGTEDPG